MLVIEDDLIYVGTPKTATISIEQALKDSGLNLEFYNTDKVRTHVHTSLHFMHEKFGYKESFCVNRDWFERWLSGFKFILISLESKNIKLKTKIEDISNEFIYNMFTVENIDKLYGGTLKEDLKYLCSYITDDLEDLIEKDSPGILKILCSSGYWIGSKKCTYEFDINNLKSLEEFISNRYNISFNIPKLNVINPERKNRFKNLVIDSELKNFIFERFEKPFLKKSI